MQHTQQPIQMDAVMGEDGLIEITSIDLLDDVVGGIVNPESVVYRLEDDDHTPL